MAKRRKVTLEQRVKALELKFSAIASHPALAIPPLFALRKQDSAVAHRADRQEVAPIEFLRADVRALAPRMAAIEEQLVQEAKDAKRPVAFNEKPKVYCGARLDETGILCSRAQGHKGDHIARDSSGEILRMWVGNML